MNHEKEAMGEQPIFTCLAHVFHIDPKTKRTWITASSKAVSVSFFYDSSRQLYRIISVEGQKAVINSTITPSMSFTQTSQKFGQWSDIRANTVYGLGFSSENELTKFVEKFHEVKEATKNVLAKSSITNGSTAVTPVTSANTSPVTGRAASVFYNDNGMNNEIEPPQSMLQSTNIQNPESPSHKLSSINNIDTKQIPVINSNNLTTATTNERGLLLGDSSGEAGSGVGRVSNNNLTHSEQQLKYENERLKTALAQSCANAKNWEIELATLKSNNTRLTNALKESTANVDEWKRQLHTYKEDNIRLKREMDMLKVGGASSGTDNSNDLINEEMRRETIALKTRIQTLEKELLTQDIELKAVNKNLKDRNNDQTIRQITDLSDKFAKQLCEMSIVHKDLEKVLQLHKST